MNSANTAALEAFWNAFSFNTLTLFALVSVLILTIAVIEQEVLRAVNPTLRLRTGRVLAIVIYPLVVLAFAVIVARFVQLA